MSTEETQLQTDPSVTGLNAPIFGDDVAMEAIRTLRRLGYTANEVRDAMHSLDQHRWLK